MSPVDDVLVHVSRLSKGDALAASDLLPLVYDELKQIAAAHLARERVNHTLQPTALAHEAYLRLVDQTRARWRDRAHFLAVAAQAIRRILIDHARHHHANKRSGGDRLAISTIDSHLQLESEVDILELEEALTRLARLSERQAKVVELRFFVGLDIEETAEALGVSPRTVKGDWRVARAWLARELGKSGPE